jgi:hypothetical protein
VFNRSVHTLDTRSVFLSLRLASSSLRAPANLTSGSKAPQADIRAVACRLFRREFVRDYLSMDRAVPSMACCVLIL